MCTKLWHLANVGISQHFLADGSNMLAAMVSTCVSNTWHPQVPSLPGAEATIFLWGQSPLRSKGGGSVKIPTLLRGRPLLLGKSLRKSNVSWIMGLEQQKHVEHGLKVILVRCKYHAAKDYVHVFHFSDGNWTVCVVISPSCMNMGHDPVWSELSEHSSILDFNQNLKQGLIIGSGPSLHSHWYTDILENDLFTVEFLCRLCLLESKEQVDFDHA